MLDQTKHILREHTCLYASFDKKATADVSRGDCVPRMNADVVRHDANEGRFGGGLVFAAKDHGWAEDEFVFSAKDNFPYRETAFDGTGNDFVSTTLIDARPAALVEGSIVNWAEMRPLLNEAAGAAILQEVILDRMLIIELARTGRSVTDRDLQRERELLYETLSPDPDVAARLAKALQIRQGLGKRRQDPFLRFLA